MQYFVHVYLQDTHISFSLGRNFIVSSNAIGSSNPEKVQITDHVVKTESKQIFRTYEQKIFGRDMNKSPRYQGRDTNFHLGWRWTRAPSVDGVSWG